MSIIENMVEHSPSFKIGGGITRSSLPSWSHLRVRSSGLVGLVATSSVFQTRQSWNLLPSNLRFWVSFNLLSSQKQIFRPPKYPVTPLKITTFRTQKKWVNLHCLYNYSVQPSHRNSKLLWGTVNRVIIGDWLYKPSSHTAIRLIKTFNCHKHSKYDPSSLKWLENTQGTSSNTPGMRKSIILVTLTSRKYMDSSRHLVISYQSDTELL